jgi:protein SCO1/2
VVLTMFFASCGYACPMLAHDMLKVQSTLPPGVRERVRFVMVSFDPERDSIERLQAFREQMDLAENWTLLRGEPGDVRTLAMLLGVKYRQEPSGDISHSNLITVLNPAGEVAHQRTGLQGGLPGVSEALVRVASAGR